MPSCFVPGCRSGYGGQVASNHFFRPPKDKDELRKWTSAIARKDRPLSRTSCVCDRHFSDDLMVKADTFVVNGERVELPRVKWKLKPGAVPHIFPNLPKHPSAPIKSRKGPIQQKKESTAKRKRKGANLYETSITHIPETRESSADILANFSHAVSSLITNLKQIGDVKRDSNFKAPEIVTVKEEIKSEEYEEPEIKTETKLEIDHNTSFFEDKHSYHLLRETPGDAFHDDMYNVLAVKEEVKFEITTEEDGLCLNSLAQEKALSFTSDTPSDQQDCDEIQNTAVKNISGSEECEDKSFTCKTCNKVFSRQFALRKHTRIHTNVKPIRCEICNKCFPWQFALVEHARLHSGDKPFKCKVCNKSFSWRSTLVHHARIHTGDKPFKCEVCGKAFTLRTTLVHHTRIHTGDKPFKCEVCNKSFAWQSTFVHHARIHTGDKPFKCKVCNKSFSWQGTLIHHTSTHTGDKLHKCEVCNKSFAWRSSLVQHTRMHNNDKLYECEVCHKRFRKQNLLDDHIHSHTSDKPFKCAVCDKGYARKNHLLRHTRTHTGVRPFKCEVCDKTFALRTTLVHHARIHTGNKPFQCGIYNKSFPWRSNLVNHASMRTDDKPFK